MVKFEIPDELANLILELRYDSNKYTEVLSNICRAYEAAAQCRTETNNEQQLYIYNVLKEYKALIELLAYYPRVK